MSINIYTDQMQYARIFGGSVLYTTEPIPREDVPKGWYAYDLCGTDSSGKPHELVYQAEEERTASILSWLPILSRGRSKLVKDMFLLTGEQVSLDEFCVMENLRRPRTSARLMLCPVSEDEAGLFYALPPEKDEELGAIGHVRIDFGRSGTEFWHSWWPRGPAGLNTQKFRNELDEVVNDLRKGVLKDLSSMREYCASNGGAIGDGWAQSYGYVLETEDYIYRLRCIPKEGDYNCYLACFDKQAQEMVLAKHSKELGMGGMSL